MTREELKVNLIAMLLFNNIVIPKRYNWIAIDKDRDVYAYMLKPATNQDNNEWIFSDNPVNEEEEYEHMGEMSYDIDDIHSSLFSVKELTL